MVGYFDQMDRNTSPDGNAGHGPRLPLALVVGLDRGTAINGPPTAEHAPPSSGGKPK